ncbi:MAG: hypothetical protein SGBAC_008785 [Bacillariaceae sp.]
MGDGLDRKIDPRDSAALKERPPRVLKPSKLDVLCGRGAPIQSHEGNVRMRTIVSKYSKRYMEARKYRKQLIAEEALEAVKQSGDKNPVRFLRKASREGYWEEVDDKTASDKIQHTLRSFVRKMEGAGSTSVASESSSSANGAGANRRASLDSLPQSRRPPSSDTIDRSALGIGALRRTSPMDMHPGYGPALPLAQKTSLPTSGLPPTMPPHYYGASSTVPNPSAAETELQYRMSLRQMSTEDLIRVVAAERAERARVQRQAVSVSIAPVSQFGQQDYQRMPTFASSFRAHVAALQREAALAEGARGTPPPERSQQDQSRPKNSKQD